jgi:hypothetical protein
MPATVRGSHYGRLSPRANSHNMKFAPVNGDRQEAQHGLSGKCPACDQRMVAKCGAHRVRHWAHRRKDLCDPWWENEGEWHRAWKEEFPDAWQEIVHPGDDGTKHIADVKIEHGGVIEFQHSRISPEERRSRAAFYGQLVWVVDGTSRKRDAGQFARAWSDNGPVWRIDRCCMWNNWDEGEIPLPYCPDARCYRFGHGRICSMRSRCRT